jgi:hypothetical protein
MAHDSEFALVLNQKIAIKRRQGFAVTSMGDRRPAGETIVGDGISVYFYELSGYQVRNLPGDFDKVRYRFLTRLGTDVQPGDMVSPMYGISGLTLGLVKDVQQIIDLNGLTHHIECLVERKG